MCKREKKPRKDYNALKRESKEKVEHMKTAGLEPEADFRKTIEDYLDFKVQMIMRGAK